MAIPASKNDRDKDSFVEDPNGDVARRVVVTATIPNSPTMTSVTPGNQENSIVWESVAGATDYVLVFQTTSGVTLETGTQIDTGSTSTTYLHTGLTNGTTYYYKVYAVGPWGNTALSANELSGTPEAYTNTLSTLFDGIDEYVTFGNNQNYEINIPFTVSMWVKITSMPSQQTLWAKATADAQVDGWGWYLTSSGQLLIQARTTTVNTSFTTSDAGPLTTGTWYHLVMTYAGASNLNGITFYVNGSALTSPGSQSLGGTILSTAPSQIARRNSSFPLAANVDEVTFWGVKLDSTEVTELYNSGTPDDPNNHSQIANLDHWYKCGDDDTFPTWSDNEGAVDGTMTNMESGDIEADVP